MAAGPGIGTSVLSIIGITPPPFLCPDPDGTLSGLGLIGVGILGLGPEIENGRKVP